MPTVNDKIRLEKHDEIVEAMTARIYANIPDASALESQRAARNALDAMLEAVVRLEVGYSAVFSYDSAHLYNGGEHQTPNALILRMEARVHAETGEKG